MAHESSDAPQPTDGRYMALAILEVLDLQMSIRKPMAVMTSAKV